MVGPGLTPHYRRGMNFLSTRDYTRARGGYNQIRVQPIVSSVTGPYHASVTQNKSRLRRKASTYEYCRDGSGRR
jgi:hypothetical protein